MKYTKPLAALVLAFTLSPHAARAQQPSAAAAPPAAKATEPTAEQLALEAKAVALLDEVVGETPALKLAENRIRLQAAAAEALWSRNEARAREIFNAATLDLASITGGIETDDPQYYNLSNAASQLRQRMMTTIAQYDPKLALEFLRATRIPPPPVQPGTNYRPQDQELMLEAQLAQQIAARDPQQALRLAEEILSRGLSSNLMPLLDQLRTRDPESATRLVAGIVKKLRTANFAADYEAVNVANYLLVSTRAPENANTSTQTPTGAPTITANLTPSRRLQLDEATRRELVSSLVNAAVNTANNSGRSPNAGSLLLTVRQLLPEVERYAPAQVAGLRRRLENLDGRVEQGNARDFRQVIETGTPDAIIEAAAKASPEMRQQLYRTAAWKALNEGNVERARQIVNTNIEGTRQREQFLRELDQQLFWRAAAEGNVEGAQALLARAKSADERVTMLIQLARVLTGKGNQKGANSFLEEAWTLIDGRAEDQTQFNLQLQLAQAYAPVAPARAFEIIEAGITHLNELVGAAAVIEGFGQEAFAQDELKTQEGYLWNALATQCSETLAVLAPFDFEQARAAADRFQRAELRLPARLAVARGILVKEGERSNFNRNTLRRDMREGFRRRRNED